MALLLYLKGNCITLSAIKLKKTGMSLKLWSRTAQRGELKYFFTKFW